MSSSSSSSSSDFDEVLGDQYRFSGYQLPKIQLDETGPSYVQLHPHPYYTTQPIYWEKPAYKGSLPLKSEIIGGESHIQPRGTSYPETPPPISTELLTESSTQQTQQIISMLPFDK